MTEALAKIDVTPEQLELVKRTVANGATGDELRLYLYDCQRQGVHPLDKLLHFTKRGGKYTPITSIDLMRIRAAETGDYLGNGDPVFAGEPQKPGFAATVTVRRLVQSQIADFTATARWSEYCPPQGQDHMWRKMPHTMLGKCAEALALRKGFPKQLAGLYAREEMEQAGAEPVVVQANVDTSTGEVLERPALPAGCCYIDNVVTSDTSNKNVKRTTVTFSDGKDYSTINPWLGTLAQAIAQEHCPVTYEVETKGRFTNLTKLERYKPLSEREPGEEVQASDIFGPEESPAF